MDEIQDPSAPPPMTDYQPSPEDAQIIGDINRKFERWREDRRAHEAVWFVNAAFYRGQQYVEWNAALAKLTTVKTPPHRIRLKINKLQAKLRARLSKFLKNRPKPIIVPATNEYKDYLNAKATQKVLDYLWRELKLEAKYRSAVQWAMIAGKGYWWFHWNPEAVGRVAVKDQASGMTSYQDEPLGDVIVEVGSPFEILVADPGEPAIGAQPEILRVKLRRLADVKSRYPEFELVLHESGDAESVFQFEQQIATLNPQHLGSSVRKKDGEKFCLVKEHFIRPCGKYPKGAYRVVAGDILVKNEDELPYGFDDQENPFPVVEFQDLQVAGQYWSPTVCEQLVDLQKEYNLYVSKLAEHLRLMAMPKLIVARQHQIPQSVWTSEPGERVEYVAIPNVPPPTAWNPPNVSGDLWNALQMIEKQFDDVSQIFPASEGKVGTASSGFQTNLLQEAADSVHAPDIRSHELSIEEAARKIRRMVKQGYDVPRLIRTIGTNYSAEVFEFSASQVDEMADVVVEVGSALPTLKAAKQDAVLQMFREGLLGDPADPEVKRRTLSLLEMGSVEEAFDMSKADENQARLENVELGDNRPLPIPKFWENHLIHYNLHTTELKGAGARQWSEQQRRALITHVVLHARYINPQSALQIAMEEQLDPAVIQMLQGLVMSMAPPPGNPPPGPSGAESPNG